MFHDIALTEFSQEILIVGDDDQLEIGVFLSFLDDATKASAIVAHHLIADTLLNKTFCQSIYVLCVQGVGGFI